MYERTGALVQKKFREYLLPTIMTSLAMSLASVIDSVIVGNLLGDTALAALGLSGPVIFCINMIYMLFGIGGVTCASVAKGRREGERANQLFTLIIRISLWIKPNHTRERINASLSPASRSITGTSISV